MFGKTFVERRSLLTMYRTFYRVWAFLILEFHFMAVRGGRCLHHAPPAAGKVEKPAAWPRAPTGLPSVALVASLNTCCLARVLC